MEQTEDHSIPADGLKKSLAKEIRQQKQLLEVGPKSVDRGIHKNGALQNKFSQMARSPQILQRKQEQILKMQSTTAAPANNNELPELLINQDLAPLYLGEGPQISVINSIKKQ